MMSFDMGIDMQVCWCLVMGCNFPCQKNKEKNSKIWYWVRKGIQKPATGRGVLDVHGKFQRISSSTCQQM